MRHRFQSLFILKKYPIIAGMMTKIVRNLYAVSVFLTVDLPDIPLVKYQLGQTSQLQLQPIPIQQHIGLSSSSWLCYQERLSCHSSVAAYPDELAEERLKVTSAPLHCLQTAHLCRVCNFVSFNMFDIITASTFYSTFITKNSR
jgi:hypothetical protein